MDTGTTAWLMTASALVLLMTPGLAFFYGGMVRSKTVLNMMMMSFIAMGIVGVLWVLIGYSMAFGGKDLSGFVGDFSVAGLSDLMVAPGEDAAYPDMAFVAFQATFAIITVALISGAVADRMKFSPWMVFVAIWVTLVYFPVAHWVWNADGWIFQLGAIDFAGGTVVHINAGIAGLALVLLLGKRLGWRKDPMRPHNLPFVMLGAGLLWFGWFGFNAGSALAADNTAAVVWVNTLVATCAAMLGWLVVERFRDGHPTSLGAASGVVAGLVAITPSCSAVSPMGAIALGAIAGVICALAVGLKFRFGFDDSLDVVAVHLVGGIVGTLLIGFLATEAAPAGVNGLFYGGGLDQLGKQAVAAGAVIGYSFVVTLIIGLVIKSVSGIRVSADDERVGLDLAVHAETAYDLTGTSGGTFAGSPAVTEKSDVEVNA
jgi:ammonium transporter, Amt family